MTLPRGGRQHIPRPAGFEIGGPPPWAALSVGERRMTIPDVRARLADLPAARPPALVAPSARAAAVLVAMFADGPDASDHAGASEAGEARVILTKRPDTMPSHQGEIAFPGGKVDPALDADARAAALREAHEEIGLDPQRVDVVAELDGIGTVASRFVIRPFVGLLAGRPALRPHPREVVSVFDVALSELLDPAAYRQEHWSGRAGAPDFRLAVQFFELPGETVWGATARILGNLLSHLTMGRSA